MKFEVTYFFTSTRADGDEYSIAIILEARNYKACETIAKLEGFSRFGARFNDNCTDWLIKAI